MRLFVKRSGGIAGPAGAVMCAALLAATAGAGDKTGEGRVVKPFNEKNLDGWTLKGAEDRSHWKVGRAEKDSENPSQLIFSEPAEGEPIEMVNAGDRGVDIYTEEKFGDCTISLEFMIPQGSNSGVYVMGEYEVQILDSYGKKEVGPGDMGGLYGAAAPRVNASKKPGAWQKILIEFQAPRFDGDQKVSNARFKKVTLNGQVIHEDVEMQEPTPGGVTGEEAPAGPLMFQGNHGPVSVRNIKITLPPEN